MTDDRLRAAQRGMRMRASLARRRAETLPKDSPAAAALRGKAVAYCESADMLEAALRGGMIHRKYEPLLSDTANVVTL